MSFHIEDLEVRYGSHVALHGVTLGFESGALGLLGPNGAGKSSLLRALLGFVHPARGRVQVLGQPLGRQPHRLRQRIGYHPEDNGLLPALNGVGSVALCGELSGLPRTDALQRAHEILFFVGLGEARYRLVETYSQGMRQRLKLAQALVHDPELLILDEPTNGLDPRGRQEMLRLVRDISREKGIHLVLSSHVLPDVESVCDQVALLDRGRLVQAGRLEDLLRAAHESYEVRIKGPADAFESALRERGAQTSTTPRGMLLVDTPSKGARLVFDAAAKAGCQVRQLTPARQSLVEMFTSSVQTEPHGGGERHADS